MKKLVSAILALTMLIAGLPALADDLGITMIGPDTQVIAETLDDMQLGTTYKIDGYATITPIEFLTIDYFAQFGEKGDYGVWRNANWNIWHVGAWTNCTFEYGSARYNDASWQDSGDSADYIWLAMDITNMQKTDVDFISECKNENDQYKIKVIYNEDYEFIGWMRQIDNDLLSKDASDGGAGRANGDRATYPNQIVLNPAHTHPIQMLYTGHYVFGCTLPSFVINDKTSPLRMEIELGDSQLTYYIVR